MKTRNLIIGIILIMILALFLSGTHSKESRDMIYEAPIEVEYWMTQPFNIDSTHEYLAEEPLELEDWMTKPFLTQNNS